jgi:hypothetical protein
MQKAVRAHVSGSGVSQTKAHQSLPRECAFVVSRVDGNPHLLLRQRPIRTAPNGEAWSGPVQFSGRRIGAKNQCPGSSGREAESAFGSERN